MILDSHRRRGLPRRAFILGVALSAAALVPLAMLKPTAKAQTSLPAQPEASALHLSDAQKQLRLGQARKIREHLAAWAQHNKAALLQMQQAQPNDLAALMPVYRSLAKQPLPLWNGDSRIGRGGTNPGFAVDVPPGMTLTHLQRSREWIFTRIRRDFADNKDFRIASSVDIGNVSIVVWASGRITESTVTGKFAGYGKPFLQVESQKSIMPSFFAPEGDKVGERLRYSIAG